MLHQARTTTTPQSSICSTPKETSMRQQHKTWYDTPQSTELQYLGPMSVNFNVILFLNFYNKFMTRYFKSFIIYIGIVNISFNVVHPQKMVL
jgi:hypothetical protein